MKEETIVFATRRSQLALAQSRAFAKDLEGRWPAVQTEELHVVTTGDRVTDVPLAQVGGKGLFTKEIEEALLDGRARFAVHSFKDVPAELAPAFAIACVPRRADPRDVLVGPAGQPPASIRSLPEGARVGTSSLRRSAQLSELRPDLAIVPLRGNVDTRLRKVDQREMDAIVLAAAGLGRLGLSDRVGTLLDPDEMIPAPGQGALAIECLAGDSSMRERLSALSDPETEIMVACERGVMAAVGANCNVPFGAHVRREAGELRLSAFYVGRARAVRAHRTAPWPTSTEDAARFGREVGEALVRDGDAT